MKRGYFRIENIVTICLALTNNSSTICRKSEGVSWWMSGFQDYSMESLGRILKVPRGVTGPKGDHQYSPEGLHEYSRDLPRGFIHPRLYHRFSLLRIYWTSLAVPRMCGRGRRRCRHCACTGARQRRFGRWLRLALVVSYKMVRVRWPTIARV